MIIIQKVINKKDFLMWRVSSKVLKKINKRLYSGFQESENCYKKKKT